MSSEKENNPIDVSSPSDTDVGETMELPQGWIYKRIRIGRVQLPYFASPVVQLILVSFTCFFCPGMYNAFNGIGGGGQVDATLSNNATVALYSTFALFSFFSGTICNKVGMRITLGIGGLGYPFYVGSFLCHKYTGNEGFVIFAGAMLGICAAMLWTAQGAVMMSYPVESQKAHFISTFWTIFNAGGFIGSLILLLENIHSAGNAINLATYIAFIVLMVCGAMLAPNLVKADKVIRKDGSRVIGMQHPTWKTEIIGLWECLRRETYIVLLFPMFFASNWFYTYHFNDVNLAKFNIRTRALNNVAYWGAQIIGAWVFACWLDWTRFTRRTRARGAFLWLCFYTLAVWGGGLAFQLTYSRESVRHLKTKMDWTDKGYAGPFVLYFFYGSFDAFWQTYVYWLLGALTNSSRKLAFYAGFYKGIQSAGAAVIYRMDALKVPYIGMFGGVWGLLAVSLVFAGPVVFRYVKNHTDEEVDLKFSDATVEDIHPDMVHHTEEKAVDV